MLFLSHLPHVETENRFINGREEHCLIIPTGINQIERSIRGNYFMTLRLIECPPNEKLITHDVQLGYTDWDEVNKARQMGYYDRSQHMGRIRVHDRTPARKVDRTNKSLNVEFKGTVTLSDIPKSLIFRNGLNDKRYVNNLVFKNPSDDAYIYTGSICVDDIPREYIQTETYTGKKFVDTIFHKLKFIDTYMNTHGLYIAKSDGTEIEIGRFREFKKDGLILNNAPKEEHTTTVNMRPPQEINGIKF